MSLLFAAAAVLVASGLLAACCGRHAVLASIVGAAGAVAGCAGSGSRGDDFVARVDRDFLPCLGCSLRLVLGRARSAFGPVPHVCARIVASGGRVRQSLPAGVSQLEAARPPLVFL